MGKSTTPTYYCLVKDNTSKNWHHMTWDCRYNGRATDKNAERYRIKLNESFKIGGCNEHISKAAGFLVHTSHVAIVRNRTHDVVARAKAPLFEVV